ncbi:MAG: ATP-binding protein [Angustibacter sp.]
MTGGAAFEGPARSAADECAELDRAIAALEGQRGVLGDEVVETALGPLRERRRRAERQLTGEQRKLVTVLFADLVDFTTLSRGLDAEDTRAVVAAYFDAWQQVITTHGGVVEKFIGDAVMAVFGLHHAREDDAHRAIRAALAMRDGLPELNRALDERYGVTLAMRVGVDSGEVVVSTLDERSGTDFVVVGDTVNRASRLQSAAPVNAVLVSADAHRPARGWFAVEPLVGLRLKGIDEPVDAFVVRSERPRGFHLDRARGVEGVETRTVGRDVELRQLQELLWDTVEDRRYTVVTVVGDAGVGKSRLLLDFDRWLGERSEDVWWFRGRATPSDENRAGALLRDLMATRFGVQESDPPPVVRAKAEAGVRLAFPDDSDAARHARTVAAWLGFELDDGAGLPRDPQVLRDQATTLLARYFAALSRSAPVVVLLEDLHWADDGSLRWLDAAAETLRERQVLVVATARPTLLEQRPLWGEGLEHHRRLGLQPLSRRESRALLRELLQHVEDLPATVVDLVADAAEGNPFYIEELVTWLVDAGVIERGSPSWRVRADRIGAVAVPSTLRGVLQARLDALTMAERVVLQRASVVGRVFWDDAVDHLDDGTGAPTSSALDQLHRRELVFQREQSAFDSAREFLFKHALLRDVAYEGVLRSRRAAYHAQAARWLAEVTERTGRVDEYAALIAEHLDRAGDPAAASWYLRAAQHARSIHALTEAVRLLSRGIELAADADADADAALRFDLHSAREQVHDRMGERTRQLADLDAMAQVADELDDPLRQVRLLTARSQAAFENSEYDSASRSAEEAAAVAARAGLVREEADALLGWGKSLTWHGQNAEARRVLDQALSRARDAGDSALEAETLRYLSMLCGNQGEYDTALELLHQAQEVLRESGDAEARSVVLAQTATALFQLGRYAEAQAVLEQALPVFRLSGHRYRVGIVLGNLASTGLMLRRVAEARRWCEEAVEIATALDDRESLATSLDVLGQLDVVLGRWNAAAQRLCAALQIADAVPAAALQTDCLAWLGEVELARGDVELALELAQRAVAVAGQAELVTEAATADLALGRVATAAGEADVAQAALERAVHRFRGLGLQAAAREGEAGLAALAAARGDWDDAVRRVEPLLTHLDVEGLSGSYRPERVLETCWRVLQHQGDERATQVAQRSRAYLEATARAVGDERLAAEYLSEPTRARLLQRSAPPA